MNPGQESDAFDELSPQVESVARPTNSPLGKPTLLPFEAQTLASLRLSWTEREFLQRLLTHSEVSYEETALALLRRTDLGATRAVYRFVNKLKRKLGPLASHIQAARGAGYVLVGKPFEGYTSHEEAAANNSEQ